MTDKREMILARLFAVLKDIPGVVTCVRNRGELPDDKRPAITLLDSDETAQDKAFNRGRIAASPNFISLQPEIYVTLDSRKPDNKLIGQDLNVLRARILKAVLTDGTLVSLCGTNGEIRYLGCITDLARGRAMDGETGLTFAFIYVLNPSEL